MLAGLIWLVDVKGLKTWTKPFVIFGANAIFLYAASGIGVKILLKISFELDGKMISGYGYLYQTVFSAFRRGFERLFPIRPVSCIHVLAHPRLDVS